MKEYTKEELWKYMKDIKVGSNVFYMDFHGKYKPGIIIEIRKCKNRNEILCNNCIGKIRIDIDKHLRCRVTYGNYHGYYNFKIKLMENFITEDEFKV